MSYIFLAYLLITECLSDGFNLISHFRDTWVMSSQWPVSEEVMNMTRCGKSGILANKQNCFDDFQLLLNIFSRKVTSLPRGLLLMEVQMEVS